MKKGGRRSAQFGPHLHGHVTPPSAGMSHVEAAGAVEHHLVGVPAVHEVFEEGIDEQSEVRHQESADPLRALPG